VPSDAAEAARQTLGGAVAAASNLPQQLAAPLLHTSYAAFAQGLHLTAIIATILMVGTAILAMTLLRNVQPSAEH
jgi:MFS transporter, DHA2 family, multidrug resistance protein